MEKIFSFQFEAGGRPVSEHRRALLRELSIATPWFNDLQMPLALQNPGGKFQATLWGSRKPWNTAEGLLYVTEQSGDLVQNWQLESLFPLAAKMLLLKHRSREVRLWDKMHLAPTDNVVVMFPAFGALWNRDVELVFLSSDWHRLNDRGYRTAKSFGLCIPLRRCAGKPTLGAGPLFPIDGQGRDIPNSKNTLFLQIHL